MKKRRIVSSSFKEMVDMCIEIANANADQLKMAQPEDRGAMIKKMIDKYKVVFAVWNEADGICVTIIKGEHAFAHALRNSFPEGELYANALAVEDHEHAEMLHRKFVNKATIH